MLPYLKTEIVKRSDRASGLVPLPKRWIVERTIAWLNRCRRLAKDWENLNSSGLAFLKIASISLAQNQIERERGTNEAQQALTILRERWPLAFPINHRDIRPLAVHRSWPWAPASCCARVA